MRMPWITWIWPILILLSTLAVTLITFLFPGVGVRPFVIMGFLFIIPGMAVARFFRFHELATEWMFALVLSFTIDAFVAGIVLYAGQWSPKNILSFLIGFCFGGAIAQLAIIHPASVVTKPLPFNIEDEVTIDLVQSFPSNIADEITLNLAQSFPSNIADEVTAELENVEDPEDTKERPVVLPQLHQSLREDTREKTVPLNKPELLGKEA